MKTKNTKTKRIGDHEFFYTNVRVTNFIERFYLEHSEKAGGNKNGQVSIAHGIQVVALQCRKRKGINTKSLYPTINH